MKKLWVVLSVILNCILLVYIFLPKEEEIIVTEPEEIVLQDESLILDEKGLALDTVNIVMLGNSITYAGDWQDVLQRTDVFNGGKPGWTTQQLSWVIKNFIIPHKPKVCFFKGGINDYTLGISTNRIYQNITEVMDSIRTVGTYPVYTTTLYQRNNIDRNKKIDSLNNRMQKFCERKGYDFVDLRPFLCKDGDILDVYVQEDNTHLEPEAYPQWAKALQPVLEKYGL